MIQSPKKKVGYRKDSKTIWERREEQKVGRDKRAAMSSERPNINTNIQRALIPVVWNILNTN